MKIMGHRGAKGEAPENTLLSFRRALAAGVQAMEFDVHLSRDGELVVIHDETVDRTTNGVGLVAQMTFAELRKLDAGEGEQVPSLQEVIDVLLPAKIEFSIEIKAPHCEQKVAEIYRRNQLYGWAQVISFDHCILKRIKEIDRGIETGCLLYGRPIDLPAIVHAAHANGISVNAHFLDESMVADCHRENIRVTTWTVNSIEEFQRVRATGVDYVCTDQPTLLCAQLVG